jgi:hypothetical protein
MVQERQIRRRPGDEEGESQTAKDGGGWNEVFEGEWERTEKASINFL